MGVFKLDVGARDHLRGRLWTTLLIALLAILIGLQVATQHVGSELGYPYALGPRTSHDLFPPWAILQWAVQWGWTMEDLLWDGAQLGLVVTCVAFSMGVVLWPYRTQTDQLHGSARWANVWDLLRSGLLAQDPKDSVVVGAYRNPLGLVQTLRHSGMENVLCYGPPRSGKGAGLVVPTLLSWEHSVFVTDLRGELYQLTSGLRHALGQRVYRFAPGETDSACWNPLDEIRLNSAHTVGDIQTIATLLVDPDGKGLEDHWQKTAQSLLVGLIFYAIHEDDHHPTLQHIDALLSEPGESSQQLWQTMASSKHVLIAACGRDMLDRPPQEAGSVLSTAKSYLALYRDPTVAHNTRHCEFRLRDLMHHAKSHTVYLVTQPADKDRLRPLVRLMLSMAVRTLAADVAFEAGQPAQHYRHRLLLMLDEFPALGKLPILAESLAFLGGYGIKAYLICQDTVQLQATYGPQETITAACHVQIAFPPNRPQTAEYLSSLLGTTTVRYRSPNRGGRHGTSYATHWTQRALLTPDECRSLPGPRKAPGGRITRPGHLLVIMAGCRPIYGIQPLYFRDRALRERAAYPATHSH